MRFEISVHGYEVIPLLDQLIAITGPEPWKKKFLTLQQQLNENEFLHDYQIERHGIELTFRNLLFERERTGVFPLRMQDQLQYSLYAFSAFGIIRVR